jgi:hypothetical protein
MDTFVLRIWVPTDETGAGGDASAARGTAQHVGSGRSGIFRDDAQLLRLLGELRTAAASDRSPEGSPAATEPPGA